MTQSTASKLALQQIYAKLNQDQAALGLAIAAYKRISQSPLFDGFYYSARYPDIAEIGLEPLAHYILHGNAEGRSTHPLFDGIYYRKIVNQNGEKPRNFLWHYLEQGYKTNFEPHKLFDSRYASTRFQNAQYSLEDFLQRSGNLYDPHPLFDVEFYLNTYPDVKASGINPLIHFVVIGAYEGRSPHPLFDSYFYLKSLGQENVQFFDLTNTENIMERLYADAKVKVWERKEFVNPLLHFLEHGAEQLWNPHPLFSTELYLKENPDLMSQENPLLHYLRTGMEKNIRTHLLFDVDYYLKQAGEEVKLSQRTPVVHYLVEGWRKGYKPHPDFNPSIALSVYDDMKNLNIEPLSQYLWKADKLEKIIPNEWFDGEFYSSVYADMNSANLTPLEHYLLHGANENRARNFFDLAKKHGIEHGFSNDDISVSEIKFARNIQPIVTIIVYGNSNLAKLTRCLGAISKQQTKIPEFEVILVNDFPEVSEVDWSSLNVDFYSSEKAGVLEFCRSHPQLLKGKKTVLIRDNMQPINAWLNELLKTFEDKTVGLVYSKIITPLGRIKAAGNKIENDGKIRRINAFYNAFDRDYLDLVEVDFGRRDCWSFRENILDELNWGELELASELIQDCNLAHQIRRSGKRVVCNPKSMVVALGEYTRASHQFEILTKDDENEWVHLLRPLAQS